MTEPVNIKSWLPTGLGAIIAVVVLIFAVLGLVDVLDTHVEEWQWGLIAALALARLV